MKGSNNKKTMQENKFNKFPFLSLIIGIIIIALLVVINYFMYWAFDITAKGTHYTAQGLLIFNVIVITWFVLRFFSILIHYLFGLKQKSPPELLIALINIFIVLFAISYIVTEVFRMPLWSLTAAGGLIGAGIGFALKGPILDFFSGIVLDIEKPVKVGQWVEVLTNLNEYAEIKGQVVRRNWRTTTILTSSKVYMTLPNRMLAESPVANFDQSQEMFFQTFSFQLDHTLSIKRARRLVLSSLLTIPEIAKYGGCQIYADKTSEEGTDYTLLYPVDNYANRHQIKSLVIAKLTETLGIYGYYKVKKHEEIHSLTFIEIAKNIDLLSALTKDELKTLSTNVKPLTYQRGDIIVKEGDTGDSMFIISEGAVEVYQEKKGKKRGSQKEEFLSYLGPFDYFGDMALLTGKKRTATVKATTNLITYEIKKSHMMPLLQARPQMAKKLSDIVAQRQLSTKLINIKDREEREQQHLTLAQQILEAIRNYFKIML